MLPRDLKPQLFSAYPPEAKKLATNYLRALQRLPLSFVPSLLREVIDYDFRFPAERKSLEKELANLNSLSSEQLAEWFGAFEKISISSQLEKMDWVNSPAQFVEQLSAHLWTTHQVDAFRNAATDYSNRLQAVRTPEPPAIPRLGITVIGHGVDSYDQPLFRKLRPHGAYYTNVSPDNGMKQLLDAAAVRAKSAPEPYAHWYIDGGEAVPHDSSLTCVSYHSLEPARAALSSKLRSEIERPGMGPEALRTTLAQMRPSDLGFDKSSDQILDRFQVKLLTEGSGTQVFSTTFAQWAAREALRRAQPLTMVVRFAPRQRQKPMNELLYGKRDSIEYDFIGSLVDADFGAYYNWLNQQRLSGADRASFLVWFEGHSQAVAIGPGLARGTSSTAASDLQQLLAWAS
jgi:hypothetical protein